MRIEIIAEDRVGITQDILAYFREVDFDLNATEVIRSHIYAHFDAGKLSFEQVKLGLKQVDGVATVREIRWLPTERRQNQLKVLLSRLPDPLFDIDNQGVILLASSAAAQVCGVEVDKLEGKNIVDFIAEPLDSILGDHPKTIELNLRRQPFQADITPVSGSGAIVILHSASRLGQQLSALSHDHGDISDIVGRSPAIRTLLDKTVRFAKLDLPVLISGETGTGKELLARTLHHQSHSPHAPFLAINCASLPENLLESELFGYAPGAFSGARRGGKPGLFELADGGTVFLDEIGEMSLYLQAKLLRFIQDYHFRRVGGTKELKVNVRVVSATHRNLETMAQQGEFREDLFYRLNVLNLEIPPLRNRADDIPLLVEHFVTKASEQIDASQVVVTPQAMTLLRSYHWPGNVRQLENLLFRTLALLDGNRLDAGHIQLPKESPSSIASKLAQAENWEQAKQQFEKALLESLYPQYPSTRKLAARLGVSHNKIAMKLKQYGIA